MDREKIRLEEKEIQMLCRTAISMTERSYAPYSRFCVGAALLAKDGTIFTGCNIENAAYTPTNCAERTAFFKAVSEGAKEFLAMAVAGGYNGIITQPTAPCGVCLQVMREFCDPETFWLFLADGKGGYQKRLLKELLPQGFGPENLGCD